jgi:hypothetical protein
MTLCTVVGWMGRNYALSGEWIFSTVEDYNKLAWNASYVYNYINGTRLDDVREAQEVMKQSIWEYVDEDTFNEMNEAQKMKVYGLVGDKYLKSHLKEYLIVNVIGLLTTYFGAFKNFWYNLWPYNTVAVGICVWIYRLFLFSEYVCIAYSFIKKRRGISFADISVMMMILYLTLASMPCGSSRFRLPISMMICFEIILLNKKETDKGAGDFLDCLLGSKI